MKLIVPSVCLVAGIGIGWCARPMAEPTVKLEAASKAEVETSRLSARDTAHSDREAEALASKTGERKKESSASSKRPVMDEKTQAAVHEAQSKMAQNMVDGQRKKFEARLAKLTAELHLTPEQQQKVREGMEKHLESLGRIYGGKAEPGGEGEAEISMMNAMTVDPLEASLTEMLNGEQQQAFEQVKAKEKQTRADTKAMKDLANVTAVVDDLTQEQRDAVYQSFNERALKADSKGNAFSQMYEGMGIQMDDELGGFQSIIMEQMEQSMKNRKPVDKQESPLKSVKQAIDQRVEDQVAALKPHLSEAQLQQYRTHLENKASTMTNMLGGAGEESDSKPTDFGTGE